MKNILKIVFEILIALAIIIFAIQTFLLFINFDLLFIGVLLLVGMVFIDVYYIDSLNIMHKVLFSNKSHFFINYIKIYGLGIIAYYIFEGFKYLFS